MAWLQDYGLVFDLAISLLLVIAIGYAVVLNRRLAVLRAAPAEMEKLFAGFAAATGQAEDGLRALKERSGEAGDRLAKNVNDACRLADEMAFLLKKGNEIADRLESAISASRKVNQVSAPFRPEAPQAPIGGAAAAVRGAADAAKPEGPPPFTAGQASPRGLAKLAKRKLSSADSELMRTLQAIR